MHNSSNKYRVPTDEQTACNVLLSARPEWLGEFGEDVWRWVLHWSRWRYISLAKIIEGGAPLAHASAGELILPDFDACYDGRGAYIEVKTKSQSAFFRKTGKERHGINQRNYEHYQRIAHEMRRHCAIAVLEMQSETRPRTLQWSGSLLVETLAELGDAEPGMNEWPPKVYWNRKQFSDLSSFSALELFAIANGELRINHCYELDRILFPLKQRAFL